MPSAGGIAAGFVARRLRKSFVNTLESIEDRNRVLNVFGQHVSPAVAEQLLAQKAQKMAASELGTLALEGGQVLREVPLVALDGRFVRVNAAYAAGDRNSLDQLVDPDGVVESRGGRGRQSWRPRLEITLEGCLTP